MNFCMHCGTVLQPDASVCPACGTPVAADPAGGEPVPTRPQDDGGLRVPMVHTAPPGVPPGVPPSSPPPTVPVRPISTVPIPAEERTIVRPGPAARPAAVPAAPATPPETPRHRRWVVPVVVAAVVVVLAGAGVAAWLVLGSSRGDTSVRLEAANATATDGAFTSSTVNPQTVGLSGFPTRMGLKFGGSEGNGNLTLRSVEGDYRNLYAALGGNSGTATTDQNACDTGSLRTQLVLDKHLADVWWRTIGISNSVTNTVDALTPVLLGQDTAVTEYKYAGGKAVPYQAILQAGTAVLIDHHAQPRVRCATGNPLALSSFGTGVDEKAVLDGAKWSGFSPDRVLVIDAAQQTDVKQLASVVDARNGRSIKFELNSPGN